MKETKYIFMRITSIILCVAMFLVFMPQAILAEAGEVHRSSRLASVVLEENEKPGEEPEYALPGSDYPEIIADKAADHAARLTFKEEMNTLVYLNDDGTETLYMFGMDVKYTDENGEIKDKSTKLALSEEGYYNPDNDIRVNFAKDLENGVSVTYNDIVISVRPSELKESVKQAELRKIALPEEDERERVIYADAFEKADIVYTPTFDGFKEDIVVNEYNGVTEYVFTAFTENARIEGHDIFRGEERIGDIGAIYVLDSEGECTYGVLEVEEIGPGEYILTVSVDTEFLENAAYPVYIDPSITIYSYGPGPKLIEDAPVYSNSSSSNGGNKYNYCGYVSSSLGYGRVLYRLPGLINDSIYYQISASQINSVLLHLREASGKSGSATVTARPFLETWTESGVKYSNVNINNYNSSSTYAASKTYSSSPKWWEFEIKETAKAWKNGTFNSWYGLVLINSNESSSTYYRNFLSTEYTNSNYYPYITMDYTPSIVVTPSTKTMYVGETFQLSASTYPSGISYTWFSMDSSIATVDSTGEVTAVAPGTTYIVANGGSNGSGTCVVTVFNQVDICYFAPTNYCYYLKNSNSTPVISEYNSSNGLIWYICKLNNSSDIFAIRSAYDGKYLAVSSGGESVVLSNGNPFTDTKLQWYRYNDDYNTPNSYIYLSEYSDSYLSLSQYSLKWCLSEYVLPERYYNEFVTITSNGYIPVSGINTNVVTDTVSLILNQTYNINAALSGSFGNAPTYNSIEYHSSDSNVVSVNSNGMLTANTIGHSLISVRSAFDHLIEQSFHVYVCQSVSSSGIKDSCEYYIRNKASDKYLSVANGSYGSGANIQQWEAENRPYFRFRFSLISENTYEICPVSNENLALDVYNASPDSGANVRQYTRNNTNAQKWTITQNADGTWRLTPVCATNNALSIETTNSNNGTNICSKAYISNDDSQQWYLEEATQHIITVHNYYDDAILERYNANNEQITSAINRYSHVAHNYFKQLFGVTISYPQSINYHTIADISCPSIVDLTKPSGTDINCECSCSGHSHETTHTSNRNMLRSMSNDTNPGLHDTRVLWIGRITWEWKDGDKKTIKDGAVTIAKKSIMVFRANNGNITNYSSIEFADNNIRTYLHELSHTFGAHDTYCDLKPGEVTCSNMYCARCYSTGYEEICVLSCNSAIFEDYYITYICDKCKQDIVDYLK